MYTIETSISNDKISKIGKYAIFIGVLINLTSGIQYCWALLGRQLISDFGWTAVQATMPYSTLTVISSSWAVIAGRWGDSSKPRYPIIFGGAMLGFGLIFSSLHQNPLLMCITAGVMLGLSSSSITTSVASSSIKWAPYSKKGLVTGIVTSMLAVSSVYMTPLINTLLANIGLKSTFIYMGTAALILVTVLAFLHPQPDKKKFEQTNNNDDNIVDNSIYKNQVTPNQALKTKELYICALIFFCMGMSGQVMTSQAMLIAEIQVPGWTGASILVILLAIANAAGRFTWSILSDKIGPFNVAKIAFAIQFINFLCFKNYQSVTSLVIGTIVLGICFGSAIPLLWATLTTVYGSKYCGSMYGMGTTVWGISGIVGPMFAAYLRDATGSYSSAYIGMAVVLLIGFVASFAIRDKKLIPSKI